MSCLSHHKRFRSLFHNIINELRNKNQIPISTLHTMPYKCCTCKEEVDETIKPEILNNKCKLLVLTDLIEKINREKEPDAKLLLSLNRLLNIIAENESTSAVSVKTSSDPTDDVVENSEDKPQRIIFSSSDDSSSDDEDIFAMETSRPLRGFRYKTPVQILNERGKVQNKKPAKKIGSGTFVFLPYAGKDKNATKNIDPLVEVAKNLQRSRFINKNGHFNLLGKEYEASISMITKKTSKQVTNALATAQQGLENLKIYHEKEALETAAKQDGEWVLVRSKKPSNQTSADKMDQLLEEITSRWMTALTVEKRASDSDDTPKRKKK